MKHMSMMPAGNFTDNVVNSFLIAFGVIIGASIFAGIGAIINDNPPLKAMLDTAVSTKIWAVAIALGGTFSSFEIIEKGFLNREIRSIIKQAVYVLVALAGANAGYGAVKLIQECGRIWIK